tara:strand:- start:8293 stop:9642 length:1350 start_codon:yes stop_codon:yes gene_type:complete
LWPNGREIYANNMPEGMKPRIREQKKEIIFPNGAKIKYQQAENTPRAKDDAQGQEFTLIGIDEACQHDWEFLEYLMSRLRSPSRHFSRLVMSCNPDSDHKIRELISWYLTEDGYADPEKEGVIRYFIKDGDTFLWGDTREEIGQKYGIPEEDWEGKILSFSFVSGLVYDNPFMLEHNKSYVAFLEGLNEVDKAQLLYGNWDARLSGSNYFLREWLKEVDTVPLGAACARGYDFAATERSQVNKSPDATTSIKMYVKDGYYYLAGEYHSSFVDDETGVSGRLCKRVGDRDNILLKQAEYDGQECTIFSPVDPGAAGVQVFTEMAKKFSSEGFVFKKDVVPTNKSKLTKFLPFAGAAENGLVYIVKNTFDKVTYEFIMKELEAFDGERSSSARHDDFPDCISTVFNSLSKAKVHKARTLPSMGGSTQLSQMRQSMSEGGSNGGMRISPYRR